MSTLTTSFTHLDLVFDVLIKQSLRRMTPLGGAHIGWQAQQQLGGCAYLERSSWVGSCCGLLCRWCRRRWCRTAQCNIYLILHMFEFCSIKPTDSCGNPSWNFDAAKQLWVAVCCPLLWQLPWPPCCHSLSFCLFRCFRPAGFWATWIHAFSVYRPGIAGCVCGGPIY